MPFQMRPDQILNEVKTFNEKLALGMTNLMEEVGATVMGICVIFVTRSPVEKLVENFTPLIWMDDENLEAGLQVSLHSES